MKILKNPIFMFILGGIILSSVTYAATKVQANEIYYNESVTVKDKIDALYIKANRIATQVATLTTQGATYTMQNDGYIVGTVATTNTRVAILECDSKTYVLTNESYAGDRDISIYVSKNTVVTTRSDGGIYNLTVYEWK